jgi:hypothetical protein
MPMRVQDGCRNFHALVTAITSGFDGNTRKCRCSEPIRLARQQTGQEIAVGIPIAKSPNRNNAIKKRTETDKSTD